MDYLVIKQGEERYGVIKMTLGSKQEIFCRENWENKPKPKSNLSHGVTQEVNLPQNQPTLMV